MNRVAFADRAEAGAALSDALHRYAGRDDVVVLALPRGGVPIGFEVARRLDAPLDVVVVRKIGAPGHEELAMGAVASGGSIVRNDRVIAHMNVDEATFAHAAKQKRREVRAREERFRGDRDALSVTGHTVLVVDDGIATGSTARAALGAIRGLGPARLVLAVPVAPPDVIPGLQDVADEVVCLQTPRAFMSVGSWYRAFPQVPDDEVRRLLDRAATRPPIS